MARKAKKTSNRSGQPQRTVQTHTDERASVAPAPPSLSPVFAVVLERVPGDPPQAKILLENRHFQKSSDGSDINFISQLTDAVVERVNKFHSDFVFNGELEVFCEDMREGGTPNDTAKMAPKQLIMEAEMMLPNGLVDSSRRNDPSNPFYVLVTRATTTQDHISPPRPPRSPRPQPGDVAIIPGHRNGSTDQILDVAGMRSIIARAAAINSDSKAPVPECPADVGILVQGILEDMNCPPHEALQRLLKPGRTLPMRVDHDLIPALLDRADIGDQADRKLWTQMQVTTSFVFLTGTSGVGKSKVAADIGKKDALVVMIPVTTSTDSPYTQLFSQIGHFGEKAKPGQLRFYAYQECAVIYFAHMMLSHLEFVLEVCECASSCGVEDRKQLLEIAIRAQQGKYHHLVQRLLAAIPAAQDPIQGKAELVARAGHLLERCRSVLPQTPVVMFHDDTQVLLDRKLQGADKLFEDIWPYQQRLEYPAELEVESKFDATSPSITPKEYPHSGLFYALICTVRYLCDDILGRHVRQVVAGTNMQMTFWRLSKYSPAHGVAGHVNMATNLSADNIRDWYASYLSDDAIAGLDVEVCKALQGRSSFASSFWRILARIGSSDLSPAENVHRAAMIAFQESHQAARSRVWSLWQRRESCGVLDGLYYSLKAGHGGLVRISARAFPQLEVAVLNGVLNVDLPHLPDHITIDLVNEPATTLAILDIGDAFLKSTTWEEDSVVVSRCIWLFGSDKGNGELLEDLFVWHVLKTCHKAGGPASLKAILWGDQDEKYWPNTLDGLTVDVTCGLRCVEGGGFLSAFEGKHGEPCFDVVLYHPPDGAASGDVMLPAKDAEGEFRLVCVWCKGVNASNLLKALSSLDMGRWFPEAVTDHELHQTKPNREFVTAFSQHTDWFASPIRVVLHTKRFRNSALSTAAFFNIALVPEQPIVLTTMGSLVPYAVNGWADNPKGLQGFTPAPIRHWDDHIGPHPQQYLVPLQRCLYNTVAELPLVGLQVVVSCVGARRQHTIDAIEKEWRGAFFGQNRVLTVDFSNVHDAVDCWMKLAGDFGRQLGVQSVKFRNDRAFAHEYPLPDKETSSNGI